MKKYQIIYADPPWSYNDKFSSKSTGDFRFKGANSCYPTQSKGWINSLPVKDISDKDCALFIWVVSPLLDEGLETIKAWGFKYKTVAFNWVKQTSTGKFISNLGRWTMGSCEICLLATKGSPQRVSLNTKQLVIAERTKHSRKPDEVRNRILEVMGDLPRIELFAREKTKGWDCIGFDIDGKDITESIKLLVCG